MSKKKDDIFFMEIFNDILRINDYDIMIVYDKENNVWFKFKDILTVLGYSVQQITHYSCVWL